MLFGSFFQLSYLSKGLENLTNLEYIDLYCNCLDSYPTEVLNISRLRCFDTEMNLFDSAIVRGSISYIYSILCKYFYYFVFRF